MGPYPWDPAHGTLPMGPHPGRPELEAEIRATIKNGASDAHVPALIKQVKKIPYTRSGKKVELAVRDLFAGVEPKNWRKQRSRNFWWQI